MVEKRKAKEQSIITTNFLKYTAIAAGVIAVLPLAYIGIGYLVRWMATPSHSPAPKVYQVKVRRGDAQKILDELLR